MALDTYRMMRNLGMPKEMVMLKRLSKMLLLRMPMR